MTQNNEPESVDSGADDVKDLNETDDKNEAASPPVGPEPEGGPRERHQAFMAERFARVSPEDAPEEDAKDLPQLPYDDPLEAAEGAGVEPPLTPHYRLDLMAQYRQRQQAQIDTQEDVPAAEEAPAGDEEHDDEEEPDSSAGAFVPFVPPVAPVPPPANNWIPIGPSVLREGQAATRPPTSGRTPGIAVAPGGNRVYVGAANGGVWRSEDAGVTWRSLMDAFDLNPTNSASDSLACGAIALVAGATTSQDRIYVGSGEGPVGGGAFFGVGPIVSTDGGANWNLPEPVTGTSQPLAGSAFFALAVDPANIERVVAATRRGIYRRQPSGAGFAWSQKSTPGLNSWATSVVAARSGSKTTFYAAGWFSSVLSSTDGHTWTTAGSGFPTTNVGRIGLAVQPSNPNVVYALIHNANNHAVLGVWRLDTSDGTSGTWRQVSGHPPFLFGNPNPLVAPGVQGGYDLAIAVDPNNVNRIYLGGSTVLSGGHWSGALFRADVTSSGSGAGLSYSMTPTHIGASVHADIHTIVFAPGDSNKLWIGCDGGVYYSTTPTGTGNIFTPRNTGLATLTMNRMDQHPTEDAVIFCGTQDNGTARFTGEETWLHAASGDGGDVVINWNDPYKVLRTYAYGIMDVASDGGQGYSSWSDANLPAAHKLNAIFYAPLEGTPRNTAAPAEAEIVAFGGDRPWISNNFGGSWQSIPNGSSADNLPSSLRSLAFASATRLFGGTMGGQVYRFDKSGSTWTRTQINTVGGSNALPGIFAVPVTAIAVDPADASGSSIYITFGGSGNYRHVWHFNGTQWQHCSGPAAGSMSSLLDVQHNAIVVDPMNTNHIYAGADIGIWQSTDGGANWTPFSQGLPDAAVLDLKLHNDRRLLRAATFGRSVFERTLGTGPKAGVELYVRDTQLDQGRFTTINDLADPTNQSSIVKHYRGPDIKLDTPDTLGNYQLPLTGTIDFNDFVDKLDDDFLNVATHASATITTRVYVQVHNRGVTPADNVQVMLLLANASTGLPALPPGYETLVQSGTTITSSDWRTVGIESLDDVRVGFPKIASFNLPSSMLPPPASLAGNDHHCVLVLIHHAGDPYQSTNTNTDANSLQERKAAHKNLKVVQFFGTVPSPPPVVMPIRIHNANPEEVLLTDLRILLSDYPGLVRLYIPPLETDGDIMDLLKGLSPDQDFDAFNRWAEVHVDMIARNQESKHPYDREWSQQRIEDIERAMETGFMLVAEEHDQIGIRRIVMEPGSYHTIFLMFYRPEDGQLGQYYPIELTQWDARREKPIGGFDARIELVEEPEQKQYFLRLWAQRWYKGGRLIRARLHDSDGQLVTPEEGAEISLLLRTDFGAFKKLGKMRWHRSWRSYYYILRHTLFPSRIRLSATASIQGKKVAEEELNI